MKNEITILGLLSYESPLYWDLCNKSIQNTISPSSKVRYIIGLDRVDRNSALQLSRILPNSYLFDISENPKNKSGKEDKTLKRKRIGNLYNKLYSKIPSDSKYCFMLDGDIAFVCKNWDMLMLSHIKDNCVVIGHEYGNRWPEKYQNFPCLQCSLFDYQKIKHLKFDFSGTAETLKIKNCDQADCFGLQVGDKLNRDIGWEWPLKIKMAGFTGKSMKLIYGNDKNASFLKANSESDKNIYRINEKQGIKSLFEFYLDEIFIGTHLTKSTCLKFDEHVISKFWIDKVKQTFA